MVRRVLLDAYIGATRSTDANAMKALLHRQASACLSSDNADFYNTMFGLLAQRRVHERYDVKVSVVDDADITHVLDIADDGGAPRVVDLLCDEL